MHASVLLTRLPDVLQSYPWPRLPWAHICPTSKSLLLSLTGTRVRPGDCGSEPGLATHTVFPVFGRLKKEDFECEVSRGYISRLWTRLKELMSKFLRSAASLGTEAIAFDIH